MRHIFGIFTICVAIFGCGSSSDPTTETSSEELIGGTPTFEFPAAGRLDIGVYLCTATLVAPRVILTAAHCVDYKSGRRTDGTFYVDRSRTVSHGFNITETRSFTKSGPSGDDLALVRLAKAVPAQVADPAGLAHQSPAPGTLVTDYGYGCTNIKTEAGVGTKRKYVHKQGGPITALCPGDSGGPMVHDGNIFAVNSGYEMSGGKVTGDIFAHVPQHRGELETQIAAWR